MKSLFQVQVFAAMFAQRQMRTCLLTPLLTDVPTPTHRSREVSDEDRDLLEELLVDHNKEHSTEGTISFSQIKYVLPAETVQNIAKDCDFLFGFHQISEHYPILSGYTVSCILRMLSDIFGDISGEELEYSELHLLDKDISMDGLDFAGLQEEDVDSDPEICDLLERL